MCMTFGFRGEVDTAPLIIIIIIAWGSEYSPRLTSGGSGKTTLSPFVSLPRQVSQRPHQGTHKLTLSPSVNFFMTPNGRNRDMAISSQIAGTTRSTNNLCQHGRTHTQTQILNILHWKVLKTWVSRHILITMKGQASSSSYVISWPGPIPDKLKWFTFFTVDTSFFLRRKENKKTNPNVTCWAGVTNKRQSWQLSDRLQKSSARVRQTWMAIPAMI